MAFESNHSSLIWDSTGSPQQFQSSSLSNIPDQYNQSLVAPLTLSQRKRNSHSTNLRLPPLKLRSTITFHSSETENTLPNTTTSSTRELRKLRDKFDRIRATLSQSLENNRHTFDKIHYKKTSFQQTIDERDELIDQLLVTSIELNNKVKELKNEIINQRRKRDNHEMRQLKLQRSLIRLNKIEDKSNEILKTNDKEKLIEEYNTRLLQLKNQYEQEIDDRDKQIEELKEQLSDKFNHQSDKHLKLLEGIKHEFYIESQKRDILQEYVEDYETNVYRARKPCCIATSFRLGKLSTQLRLYLIMELTLHELFHSSCSCGSFRRSYQEFLRLHKK